MKCKKNCPNEARPNRKKCVTCAQKDNEYNRRHFRDLKSAGVCVRRCGAVAAIGRGGCCDRHAEQNIECCRARREGRKPVVPAAQP